MTISTLPDLAASLSAIATSTKLVSGDFDSSALDSSSGVSAASSLRFSASEFVLKPLSSSSETSSPPDTATTPLAPTTPPATPHLPMTPCQNKAAKSLRADAACFVPPAPRTAAVDSCKEQPEAAQQQAFAPPPPPPPPPLQQQLPHPSYYPEPYEQYRDQFAYNHYNGGAPLDMYHMDGAAGWFASHDAAYGGAGYNNCVDPRQAYFQPTADGSAGAQQYWDASVPCAQQYSHAAAPGAPPPPPEYWGDAYPGAAYPAYHVTAEARMPASSDHVAPDGEVSSSSHSGADVTDQHQLRQYSQPPPAPRRSHNQHGAKHNTHPHTHGAVAGPTAPPSETTARTLGKVTQAKGAAVPPAAASRSGAPRRSGLGNGSNSGGGARSERPRLPRGAAAAGAIRLHDASAFPSLGSVAKAAVAPTSPAGSKGAAAAAAAAAAVAALKEGPAAAARTAAAAAATSAASPATADDTSPSSDVSVCAVADDDSVQHTPSIVSHLVDCSSFVSTSSSSSAVDATEVAEGQASVVAAAATTTAEPALSVPVEVASPAVVPPASAKSSSTDSNSPAASEHDSAPVATPIEPIGDITPPLKTADSAVTPAADSPAPAAETPPVEAATKPAAPAARQHAAGTKAWRGPSFAAILKTAPAAVPEPAVAAPAATPAVQATSPAVQAAPAVSAVKAPLTPAKEQQQQPKRPAAGNAKGPRKAAPADGGPSGAAAGTGGAASRGGASSDAGAARRAAPRKVAHLVDLSCLSSHDAAEAVRAAITPPFPPGVNTLRLNISEEGAAARKGSYSLPFAVHQLLNEHGLYARTVAQGMAEVNLFPRTPLQPRYPPHGASPPPAAAPGESVAQRSDWRPRPAGRPQGKKETLSKEAAAAHPMEESVALAQERDGAPAKEEGDAPAQTESSAQPNDETAAQLAVA